ncbi:MAG: hypothetical protein Tsb0013_03260 [Phycisphaerales bacterium]
MLREAVSSIGLSFFPIAALLLFLIAYFSVIGRSMIKNSRKHWNDMARMALEEGGEPTDKEGAR